MWYGHICVLERSLWQQCGIWIGKMEKQRQEVQISWDFVVWSTFQVCPGLKDSWDMGFLVLKPWWSRANRIAGHSTTVTVEVIQSKLCTWYSRNIRISSQIWNWPVSEIVWGVKYNFIYETCGMLLKDITVFSLYQSPFRSAAHSTHLSWQLESIHLFLILRKHSLLSFWN